jgi:hypothetical protein
MPPVVRRLCSSSHSLVHHVIVNQHSAESRDNPGGYDLYARYGRYAVSRTCRRKPAGGGPRHHSHIAIAAAVMGVPMASVRAAPQSPFEGGRSSAR